MKRSYKKISGGYSRRRPNYRKRMMARRGGLVPAYSGFHPRSFMRGEWKYIDANLSAPMNTVPVYTLMNALAPGTGASQRVGQNVLIRSLELRGYLAADGGAANSQTVRWLVLLDRQTNGAVPAAVTDFLNPGTVNGLRALTNRKRFKILLDRTSVLSPFTQDGAQSKFHIYMKFRRPIKVEFNGGVAGTIADIATNSLFFVAMGTEAAGATDGLYAVTFRIRYTDL